MSMKNSSDTIGNRTRDIPICSVVPHVHVVIHSTSIIYLEGTLQCPCVPESTRYSFFLGPFIVSEELRSILQVTIVRTTVTVQSILAANVYFLDRDICRGE
jgi:hypothetical protein